MSNTRIVQCDLCQGSGWINIDLNRHPTLGWLQRRCGGCEGRGVYEVETEPVTMEDLEEAHGGEHR